MSEYYYNGLSLEKAQAKYRQLYRVKKDEPIDIGDKDRIRQINKEIKNHNSSIKLLKGELLNFTAYAQSNQRATRRVCR